MALVSPGVEVSIVDQSQYLPAPTNSIPFILLATAQNKANPTGTGVAVATTAANANKLFLVTSQRDLVTLYGNPFFYTTTNGTPIQGYELNEYGLLAAYSALGVTNQVYCLRADIDLASLVGSVSRPSSDPTDGSWWLDATTSTWGIYVWSAATETFAVQTPIVITDSSSIDGTTGLPLSTIGSIGSYAVYSGVNSSSSNTNGSYLTPSDTDAKEFFYKTPSNTWTSLGSQDWLMEVPTVVGTASNPTLTGADSFLIDLGNGLTTTITGCTSVQDVANAINLNAWVELTASVSSAGRLQIFSAQAGDQSSPKSITLSTVDDILADLGIAEGEYYQPTLVYGTSAQAPLWQASQTIPRPTGSIWLKVGSAGNGLSPIISQYSDLSATWIAKTVNMAPSDWAATASLDSSGGQSIPKNTVYAQYNYYNEYNQGPVYYYERIETGSTVVTGTETTGISCPAGDVYVQISEPNSNALSSTYTVAVTASANATVFVNNWNTAAIPYTTASVTTSGAVQLVHTQGGEIVVSDFDSSTGNSLAILSEIGITPTETTGCKYGPSEAFTFTPTQTSVSPSGGTGLSIEVTTSYETFFVDPNNIVAGGAGYSVGDVVTFSGTQFGGTAPANNLVVVVAAENGSGVVTEVTYISGTAPSAYKTVLSNWYPFEFTASSTSPVNTPANGTNWFYSTVSQVDVMINYNGAWRGYKNQNYDSNGFPTPTGSNTTDPNGPIISASEPTAQSDGTALVYGDIWIDTTDLENYPVMYRWQAVSSVDKWVLIDTADQVSANGIVFADARWGTSGAIDPVNDAIPTIKSLLSSDYVDLDILDPALYPTGMLLFNTRRSGYNVKQFVTNYFTSSNYPEAGAYNPSSPTNTANLPEFSYTWVSVSGLNYTGAAYMGRQAQRAMVVQALRASIDTNLSIRDEDTFFNLMACPNYPELQPNMVILNGDRGETGYILGDTPMRLSDQAAAIQAWANNTAGATSTGEAGCVTRNTYLGLFYPSGLAPDLSGNLVAVPPSHMMLRTFIRNDSIAYPWFAAAGTRRGTIDNATNIGYLDATTGEFITTKNRIGIRDVLYTNFINPLVFFTGNGLLNYGNKTSFNSQSALDRTNVARLVAYLRRQLTVAARPFVFEPNDPLTRSQITGVVQTLLLDIQAKRGIYDYLVVCDESNNTPARIDRNELWIDVAIEPVKAAEFIYIPVRILNTGELSGA